jgi:hypothetical protein
VAVNAGLPTLLVVAPLPHPLLVGSGALDATDLIGASSGRDSHNVGYSCMPVHQVGRDLDGAEPCGVT